MLDRMSREIQQLQLTHGIEAPPFVVKPDPNAAAAAGKDAKDKSKGEGYMCVCMCDLCVICVFVNERRKET